MNAAAPRAAVLTSAVAFVAISDASEAYCARLRARFGLAPDAGPATDPAAPRGLAYCGREFRADPSMTIADAARFYGTLHARWNTARLLDLLRLAGLEERFEIGRMKRAFQRAIVLAFALASEPDVLIVENAEEFDEDGARAVLERALALVSRAIVTYGAAVERPLAGLPLALDAASYPPERT